MKSFYKIGASFLLIMFMALIYSTMALAAGLVVSNQTCTESNGTVTFKISIVDAPNAVESFGFNLSYDGNILEFVSFGGSNLPAFTVMGNKNPTQPILTIGGFIMAAQTSVTAGYNGTVGEAVFTVKSCEPVTVGISNLIEGVANWPTQAGQLIAPVFNPPVLEPIDDIVVMVGDPVSFTAQATDEDGDAISYSITNEPAGAYFGTQSGEFSWTPNPGQAGTYPDITITATDSTGRADDTVFQITVTAPHAPVFAAISKQTVMAGSPLSYTAQATDEDGDSIAYSAADLPDGATFDELSGTLLWTPAADQIGSYAVSITATDSTGLSVTAPITIDVVLAPIVVSTQSCGGDGETVTFTISVNSAPNAVNSAGFEVIYDESILEYKSNAKGTLTQGFELFGVSKLVSKPNTLRFGGVGSEGIAQGSSGSILQLVFTVKSCGPTTISLANVEEDDLGGWSIKNGQLIVAPSIICPVDAVVEAERANGVSVSNAGIQAFLNQAAAYDAQNNSFVVTNDAPAVFPLGPTTVTFSTADGSGYSVGCTATVTVTDTIAPVLSCPGDITVEAESASGASASNVQINAFLNGTMVSDAVGGVNVTTNAPADFAMGKTDITFTATDGAGNPSTCTASVTVSDSIAPVISCPANISVEAAGANGTSAGNGVIQAFLNGATATDNLGGAVTITTNAPANFALGNTDVIFTATDGAENSSTCTAIVNVFNPIPPVISCPPTLSVEAEGPNGVPAARSAIQAFLNGAEAHDFQNNPLVVSNDAPAAFGLGTTDVTFSATDSFSNVSPCTAQVIVFDTTDPIISCPANISVEATGSDGVSASNAKVQALLEGATATDTVDGSLNVTNNAPAVFPLGIKTVTFSAADKSGNVSTCTAKVTVTDSIAPAIICPSGITVEAAGPQGVSASNAAIQDFLQAATAMDIVNGRVTVTNNAPDVFAFGNTEVIFAATDNAYNTNSCTVNVSVVDTTGPVIISPANILVAAAGPQGVSASNAAIQDFLNAATANDTVDGPVNVTNNAPVQFSLGVTTVSLSATDNAGNSETINAAVTVTDQTVPVITCPGNMSVDSTSVEGVSGNNANIQAFLSGVQATDNVDSSVSISNDAPTQFASGNTTVTFSATDSAGNTAICTAIVTVKQIYTYYTSTGNLLGGSLFTTIYDRYIPYTMPIMHTSDTPPGTGNVTSSYPYQGASNMYLPYNQNLYNFQLQSWPVYQATSNMNWNYQQWPLLWQPAWLY